MGKGSRPTTPDYLENMWTRLNRELDPSDPEQKNEDGPDFSKVMLAIPTERFGNADAFEAHKKTAQLLSKNTKIGSAEDIEEDQKEVTKGLANFADPMFAKTGGGLHATLARMGQSSASNSSGVPLSFQIRTVLQVSRRRALEQTS